MPIQREVSRNIINFEEFRKWLLQNYRPFTARPVLVYAKKYGYCLVNRNFSIIGTFSDGKRSSVIKALCTLSKYLGMHEEFKTLLKNYGLKWSGRKSEDIIIDRLLKNPNDKELFQWIRSARNISELKTLLDLMIAAGLRLIEGVECHNLIIELSREGKLDSYYNRDRQVLEHFRFKSLFIRNSKKVFISFVPSEIINSIAEAQPVNYERVQKLAECHLNKLRYSDIRELFASLSVKYLRQPEIDFLQGRISASVFLRNYFNPQFINDLHDRALENSRKMLALTNGVIFDASSPTETMGNRQRQQVVSEAELPKLLGQGWRVTNVLQSGRIVISYEHQGI